MTRRFLDDVRSDIATLFPDNAIGDISPADLRLVTTDMIDSTIQDECTIFGATPVVGHVTAATFEDITVGFTDTQGGDGVFLKPNAAGGTIVTNTVAGFTYLIWGGISVELANGIAVNFVLRKANGNLISVPIGVTGRGAGNPVSVQLRGLMNAAATDEAVSLAVQTPDGASTIDIQVQSLTAIIEPTNNP